MLKKTDMQTTELQYNELTDHLGNVMITFSDRKLRFVGTYYPDVKMVADYYPFGYLMPGRSKYLNIYRYGFNSQEADNEVYGDKQSYTAEFWQYDTRLGRRWNIDPVQHPSLSPFSAFADNPVRWKDPLGIDTIELDRRGTEISRRSGGSEPVITLPEPVEVKPNKDVTPAPKESSKPNPKTNPYRTGSLPWLAYQNNSNNANLWNNRSRFTWSNSTQSPWMRNFNRAFGWLPLAALSVPAIEILAPVAVSVSGSAVTEAKVAIPLFRQRINSFARYATIRSYGVYTTVTSSELYYLSLFYGSKIMGLPGIQLGIGGFIGYYGTKTDMLPPDFSTGIPWIDLGIQSGSLKFWIDDQEQ
jgi:RHS repeat-associated protein